MYLHVCMYVFMYVCFDPNSEVTPVLRKKHFGKYVMNVVFTSCIETNIK